MRTRTPVFDRNFLVLSVAAVFLVDAQACGTNDNSSDRVGDAADVLQDTDSTDNDAAADGSADTSGFEVVTLGEGITATILPENSRVVALQAVDWAWEGFNHRVSQMGVWPTQGPDGALQSAELTFVGGDFTTGAIAEDDAIVSARWVSFAASRAAYIDVRAMVPSDETLLQRIDISPLLPLWGDGVIQVAIVGMRFNTGVEQPEEYPDNYEPALGFTNRGLGVRASLEGLSNRGLQIDLRFEHGLAEDEVLRADMNAAMPFAQTAAEVRIVLFKPANDVPSDWFVHEFEFEQEGDPPRFTSDLQPEPSDALRAFTAPAPGAPVGNVVLSGFFLKFFNHCSPLDDCYGMGECVGDCVFEGFAPGEYIRRFAIGVETIQCSDEAEACEFRFAAHAGNESQGPVFRAMRYEAFGRFVWVSDPTAVVQEGSAEFPAGTTTVEF
jgi:hypothetical protein